MGRFDGRVAVVTGAARGIGFGTATRFAEEGASVAVLDLDESAAAEAAAKLPLTDGAKAIGIGCDVSDTESGEAAVERVVAELLRLPRALRVFLWVFLALTVPSTIYLGWHYAVDAVGGAVLGVAGAWIAARGTGQEFRRRPVPTRLRAHAERVS